MNALFATALIVLLFAGCRSTPTQTDEPRSTSFLPLAEDNWWRYSGGRGPGDTAYYYVSGLIDHGGVMYATLMGSEKLGSSESLTIEELRVDDDGRVYEVRNPSPDAFEEVLVLDPSLAVGERLGTTIITRKGFADTVPAGRFAGCIEVVSEGFDTEPATYAPGIGPLRRYSMVRNRDGNASQFQLTEAFVNGVHYP